MRKYIDAGWRRRHTGRGSRGSGDRSLHRPIFANGSAPIPALTGSRLFRELKELGYDGGYTAVTDFLRDIRPAPEPGFELRFETPPGEQAQVDFAQFQVVFTDEPTRPRIVWLFSMVLGYSRLIWARFVVHQDLPTVLRCHAAAFEAIGGVPREILYDRMKTAVIGEGDTGGIVYNRALVDLARHYGFHPKACQPYRAKTKGKVERPFRYIREDFFLARFFRNLDDLNAQLRHWLDTVANPRRTPPPAGRQRGFRRGAAAAAAVAPGPVPRGAEARAPHQPRRHGLASAATSTACPTPLGVAPSRSIRWPTRSASSRTAR